MWRPNGRTQVAPAVKHEKINRLRQQAIIVKVFEDFQETFFKKFLEPPEAVRYSPKISLTLLAMASASFAWFSGSR